MTFRTNHWNLYKFINRNTYLRGMLYEFSAPTTSLLISPNSPFPGNMMLENQLYGVVRPNWLNFHRNSLKITSSIWNGSRCAGFISERMRSCENRLPAFFIHHLHGSSHYDVRRMATRMRHTVPKLIQSKYLWINNLWAKFPQSIAHTRSVFISSDDMNRKPLYHNIHFWLLSINFNNFISRY